MRVFFDRSALYAVLDRDDAHHAGAGAIWQELLERGRDLLTTNYVLLEAAVFLQNRLGLASLHHFMKTLHPF